MLFRVTRYSVGTQKSHPGHFLRVPTIYLEETIIVVNGRKMVIWRIIKVEIQIVTPLTLILHSSREGEAGVRTPSS